MAVTFNKVSYSYCKDSPFCVVALRDVDLNIQEGSITAVIGHTGSGKSTLLQHLNGLLIPQTGSVEINGRTITNKTKSSSLKELRREVGLVFQFPQYQLFEETVLDDVAFGPKNFGASKKEALQKAQKALEEVGLEQGFWDRAPSELSGGQKRRAAIAGILALQPSVLVLDEPTSSLDYAGAFEIISRVVSLNKEQGKTVIIVSHDYNLVYSICSNIVVMDDGKVQYNGTTEDLFDDEELCSKLGLVLPDVVRFRKELVKNGMKLADGGKGLKTLNDIALAVQKENTDV